VKPTNFFAELKRRNVYKVAVAYAVVAWLVMQIPSVIACLLLAACTRTKAPLLVKAGLTPLEALRTATLNPARVLGLANSLGTIEPGKLADLVLLDANPLEDIHNTRKIRAVLADGRLFRRVDLDRLLAEVEAVNRPPEE
jgi:cytosine/adenosine deaminase-related metal-dependent hydrolase